jgi:release factor glutamine methyltransferase
LVVAQENAKRHGVHHRVTFLAGNLLSPIQLLGLQGHLDAIVSNPPYIPDADLSALQPEVGLFEPHWMEEMTDLFSTGASSVKPLIFSSPMAY